jgi:putative nucleotidyltransferase with HDIG domain
VTIIQPRIFNEIPVFPAVAIKTLQVISNENGQLRSLSELITTDAAISGQILHMANSALFGVRVEVTSIFQAIHILGLERVKALVVTVAMKAYLGSSIDAPALRACWRHGLACATVAEKLARFTFMEPDVAYTAGLLHDVGRLALIAGYPSEYAALLTDLETNPGDALERERNLFGLDHCQVGRQLVDMWNLPKMFAAITSQHHEQATAGESPFLTTVRQSCVIADALGFNAVCALPIRNYHDIVAEIPVNESSQLPRDPAELTYFIASRINSIESAS